MSAKAYEEDRRWGLDPGLWIDPGSLGNGIRADESDVEVSAMPMLVFAGENSFH